MLDIMGDRGANLFATSVVNAASRIKLFDNILSEKVFDGPGGVDKRQIYATFVKEFLGLLKVEEGADRANLTRFLSLPGDFPPMRVELGESGFKTTTSAIYCMLRHVKERGGVLTNVPKWTDRESNLHAGILALLDEAQSRMLIAYGVGPL